MCDCGVVAAVVLGLGHGHLERVQVRTDHVGSQARHLSLTLALGPQLVCDDIHRVLLMVRITISPSPSSVNKNLMTTVSVEGGSGLVNTSKVSGGETFYDRTLPKHTFQ